eukprot:SAG11_NODE_36873_length_259_cov_0.975000_1_plen_48_part_01
MALQTTAIAKGAAQDDGTTAAVPPPSAAAATRGFALFLLVKFFDGALH